MKKKSFLIVLFAVIITIVGLIVYLSNKEEPQEPEMSDYDKIWYAENLYFDLRIFDYDKGIWYRGNDYSAARAATNDGYFTDFYTEIRFVIRPEIPSDVPTTVILAFPNEDKYEDELELILNLLNWEVDSANIDLDKLGLSYPITAEDLVNNYEEIDWLMKLDFGFRALLIRLPIDGGYYMGIKVSRIDFELIRVSGLSEENAQAVRDILDELGMTEDEAGPIIRAAGSFDGFVAVAELMLSEGLSAEAALKQYAKEQK